MVCAPASRMALARERYWALVPRLLATCAIAVLLSGPLGCGGCEDRVSTRSGDGDSGVDGGQDGGTPDSGADDGGDDGGILCTYDWEYDGGFPDAGSCGACTSDNDCSWRASGCCALCANQTDRIPPPLPCGPACLPPPPTCRCVNGLCFARIEACYCPP